MAGQQGSKRFGQVLPPTDLAPNTDVTSSKVRSIKAAKTGRSCSCMPLCSIHVLLPHHHQHCLLNIEIDAH